MSFSVSNWQDNISNLLLFTLCRMLIYCIHKLPLWSKLFNKFSIVATHSAIWPSVRVLTTILVAAVLIQSFSVCFYFALSFHHILSILSSVYSYSQLAGSLRLISLTSRQLHPNNCVRLSQKEIKKIVIPCQASRLQHFRFNQYDSALYCVDYDYGQCRKREREPKNRKRKQKTNKDNEIDFTFISCNFVSVFPIHLLYHPVHSLFENEIFALIPIAVLHWTLNT